MAEVTKWKQLGPAIVRRWTTRDSFFSATRFGHRVWRLEVSPSGKHRVKAGCRNLTINEYRTHITDTYHEHGYDASERATASHLILDIFQQRLDEYLAKLKRAKAKARPAKKAAPKRPAKKARAKR